MSNIESLYPHNKKVFIEAMKNLKTHKKLGIVQATGTGKGKLASCFVEHVLKRKPNAKILICAPLITVLENYKDNFGLSVKDVTFMTYSGLLKFNYNYLFNIGLKYDLVIVDEFHRLGGQEWGKCIKTIIEGVDSPKSTCRVLGFTATPIRYLDNSRDMGVELFEGNIIQGVNLEDAICEGILPGFVYNACYFSTEDKLAEVEKKLASNDYKIVDDTIRNDLMVKVKELRMLYHNKLKIENILKETTKDLGTNQKWIIFCRDKDSLKEIREICKAWFISEPSLYIIHSDKNTVDNKRILKEFRESKSGVNVLLCIDMLNEGVHIKDIDGIIMLRKTDSPIIFLQQLGRALEAGKTTQPLIYDLVGNYKDLKVENEGLTKTPMTIVKSISEKVKKVAKSNYVIVRNFAEDLDNLLYELSKYINPISSHKWLPEEDAIILKYYKSGGFKECQKQGLTDFSASSIRCRARTLGVAEVRSDYWRPEEDDILRKYYLSEGVKGCIERGLDRTEQSIASRANILGLKRRVDWEPWEDEIVKTYYPEGGPEACQNNGLSHRSWKSLISRAMKLGSQLNYKFYAEWEDDIIRKYYITGGYTACQENGLAHRPKEGIISRASKIGATATKRNIWTEEELNILRKYYVTGGTRKCIEMGINKSPSSIRCQASKLGLKKVVRNSR